MKNKYAIKYIYPVSVFLLLVSPAFAGETYRDRQLFMAKSFLNKAETYMREGAFFRSRSYYLRAYRKFTSAGDPGGQFHSLKGLGDLNMRRGYIDRAFDMYNRARYFAYQGGQVYTSMYVDLCRNVARVHEHHKYYQNAVEYMKIAVQIGGRIGDGLHQQDVAFLAKLTALYQKHGAVGR